MTTNLQTAMLEAIEQELQNQVARLDQPRTKPFHEMLTYHMGWTGEGAGPNATGKRIRPLLTLLTTASCMEDANTNPTSNPALPPTSALPTLNWLHAKPAAAAIELIHNFSLAHDDIQDNSELRRGRHTLWVKWGAPMAINVGDALFVLANQAALDLAQHYPAGIVVKAATILNDNCLELTRGQYLDMSYEERNDLSIEEYWQMIGGKTSALLATCTHIGSLLGFADDAKQEAYRLFGYHLGLAFQVQDDILGIWGNEAVTGKSAASDLVEGKNSLPVIFGLEKNGKFAERWRQGPIMAGEVKRIAALLEEEGAREFAAKMSRQETQKALDYLKEANPRGEAGGIIIGLADMLLKREQ